MPREKILYTSVEWFDVPDEVSTDDLPEELIDAQKNGEITLKYLPQNYVRPSKHS